MKVRPLHDRVLIKRVGSSETTAGGIIIPDAAQEKPQEGVVVAVGSGRVLDDGTVRPLNLKVKDKILFGQFGGAEIGLGGDDYLILKEDEILAIIGK